MTKEWDVFISHASEDKRAAALPLDEALKREGYEVWIDKHELSAGDSLRTRINEGLARSRYGVVIISPSFLSKQWTQDELNALLSREEAGGKAVIIVRHQVSHDEVVRAYPLIGDRLSLALEDGLEVVVSQIMEAIGRPEKVVAPAIAVDYSHGQHQWWHFDSSIAQRGLRVAGVERGILEQPEILEASRVLIVPLPMDTHFVAAELDRLERWVEAGGGLFLMGYYDERHHGSNVSELAWRFNFDFNHDLLLPAQDDAAGEQLLRQHARSHVSSREPRYAVRPRLDTRSPSHPITNGVQELAFISAASVVSTSIEMPEAVIQSPDDTWIMRPVGHIEPDGSRPVIDTWEPDRQGGATLLAARTWNRGRVVVAGSWKLWTVNYGDNGKLIDNVLTWLAGE